MHPIKQLAFVVMVILLLAFSAFTSLAVPPEINYQGKLTDINGDPVTENPVLMQFGVYEAASGGTALWSESQSVNINKGVFNVRLGSVTFFPASLFNGERFLGITLGAGTEMTPRHPLISVPYALAANDAATLEGHGASEFSLTGHDHDDRYNTKTEIATLLVGKADSDHNHDDTYNTKAEITIALAGKADIVHEHSGEDISSGTVADAFIAASITRNSELSAGLAGKADIGHNHDGSYYSKAYVDALVNRITALETLLIHFSRSGNEITISGANLHINSATGSTDGSVNGLGNLIVGYNEERGSGDDRSGSHNIVVGVMQNFSSYGGLVVGFSNNIEGPSASITGGYNNTASGTASSVSGGENNTAYWSASCVTGGSNNTASGTASSVSGGYGNTASGLYTSVSSGGFNTASGDSASVSGGFGNTASYYYSSVSGGTNNIASNVYSSVSGGDNNTASGRSASISGGQSNTASGEFSSVSGGDNNIGSFDFASISGGRFNTASGDSASVSGGSGNTASGAAASVSGGAANVASGNFSSVAGGGGALDHLGNIAFANYSSILGGRANGTGDVSRSYNSGGGYYELTPGTDHSIGYQTTVSGGYANLARSEYSSVSGGHRNTAYGAYSSISGGDFNTANGQYSSISGGSMNGVDTNAAAGSVSGGFNRSVSGNADWRAGDLWQDM